MPQPQRREESGRRWWGRCLVSRGASAVMGAHRAASAAVAPAAESKDARLRAGGTKTVPAGKAVGLLSVRRRHALVDSRSI